MFVDDDSSVLKQARIFLEEENERLDVETVGSAERGLELLDEDGFDAIVSDYQMPQMDGLEFLKTVKEVRNYDIPFIIFTGKGREEVAMEALNRGADRYLQKGGSPKTQYGVLAQAIVQEVEHYGSEEAFERSEDRYRRLFETAHDGMLILNAETGKIKDANPYIQELTGYSKEELVGRELWEIGTFRHIVKNKERFEELVEGGFIRYEDLPLETKKGEEAPVEFVSNTYQVGGEKVVQCNIRDISERKKREEEIKERHRQIETFFSNLPGMAYRSLNDKDWTMKFLSDGCEKLTGYRPEELIEDNELSFSELIIPEDRESVWEEVQEALEKEEPFQPTYRIETKDGQKKWVWERGKGIFDEEGEVKFLEGIIQDITERKKMEEELRESEKRYRDLFESAKSAIIVHGPDGRIISANPYAEEAFGLEEKELKEKSLDYWKGILYKENGEPMDISEFPVSKVYKSKKPVEENVIGISPEVKSEIKWYIISAVPRFNEKNEIEKVITSFKNISDQKRAEERLESFVNAIPDLVVVLDEEGYYEEILTSQHKMLYEPREELLGKRIDKVFPEDLGASMLDFVQRTIESSEVQKIEYSLNLDGEKHWFEARALPLKREGKGSESVVSVIRDITQRKQTEQRLRESEEKYRAITEESHDAIFIVGEEKFLFANDRASELTGYSEEELYDMKWWNLLHPEDREEVKEIDRKGREGEEVPTTRYEARILSEGSEVKHADFSVTPIEYEGELAVLGTVRDITEKKEANERTEFLNTLLRQDLGSKYQSIQGYLQLLERVELSGEYGKYLDEAMEDVAEAGEILELARDFQEIEESKWITEKDIVEILNYAIADVSDLVDSEGVEIEGNYPEKISKVKGNYSLNTLFSEILKTRIRTTDCDKIRISVKETDGKILAKIEDNGEFLPDEVKKLTSGDLYTGETTGVGGVRYYMIGKIAENNQGKVKVEDSELGGARFDVYLKKADDLNGVR